MISPHITDEFDKKEHTKPQPPSMVAMQTHVTTETAWAIHARAEETGKTPAELAGLLLACAVLMWKAGD